MGRKNENSRRGGTRNRRLQNKVDELELLLTNNTAAMEEGPHKKHWSVHDIRNIKPLTPTQEDMFYHFFEGQNICAHGSAGTGKTFLSLFLALAEIFKKDCPQNKIIIVRSAVASRDIGHMPGDYDEKIALYEMPYVDICQELLGKSNSYYDLKAAGKIRFMTTSYMRGVTWDDAIVIVDEFQNMPIHEIDNIMTRIGMHTRVLLCGDAKYQCDLRKGEKSGADDLIRIVKNISSFVTIEFTKNDIVRSEFVKKWILAREDLKI